MRFIAPRDGAAPVLTAYLDHLQHASATAQVAGTLLTALTIGLGPFAVAALIDHVRTVRASQSAR